MTPFHKETMIPDSLFRQITAIRAEQPDYILDAAKQRKRRDRFVPDGKMNVVAADHPARGSVGVRDEPFAMADRHDLLSRLVSVLNSRWVDGVLASMDILEELLILHEMMREKGNGFLDNKLLIASLNRGGMPGAVWELDDPITGTDAATCRAYGLDAAKMLLRIDPASADSLKTILYCKAGVDEFNKAGLPMILEPLAVSQAQNGYRVEKDPDMLIKLVPMASALGSSSRNLWLKLPYTKNFERVAAATTLPVVILGGDRNSGLEQLLSDIRGAMEAGHQIRGTMIGRSVLYPPEGDPVHAAEAIGRLVHTEENPSP